MASRAAGTPGKPPPKKRILNNMADEIRQNDLIDKMDIIMQKLNKLDILDKLVTEITDLKQSLEYAHSEIQDLKQENKNLQEEVEKISVAHTNTVDTLTRHEKTMIDIQARSMRDNLIFSGIPETEGENTEDILSEFIRKELGYGEQISFERVHRIGPRHGQNGPKHRPIVAKFSHFKTKEEVRKKGPNLRGKPFGINEQFPQEIVNRRKELMPMLRKAKREGHKATISVDRLIIDGVRYQPSKEELDQARKEQMGPVHQHHQQHPRSPTSINTSSSQQPQQHQRQQQQWQPGTNNSTYKK